MMLPMMGRKRQAEVTFETSKGIKDMEYIKIHAKEMYQDTLDEVLKKLKQNQEYQTKLKLYT